MVLNLWPSAAINHEFLPSVPKGSNMNVRETMLHLRATEQAANLVTENQPAKKKVNRGSTGSYARQSYVEHASDENDDDDDDSNGGVRTGL